MTLKWEFGKNRNKKTVAVAHFIFKKMERFEGVYFVWKSINHWTRVYNTCVYNCPHSLCFFKYAFSKTDSVVLTTKVEWNNVQCVFCKQKAKITKQHWNTFFIRGKTCFCNLTFHTAIEVFQILVSFSFHL